MSKPYWVQVGMLGIKTRAIAKTWLLTSVVVSILFTVVVIIIFKTYRGMPILLTLVFGLSGALILFLSSLWYWLCIKWMDKNDCWQKKSDDHIDVERKAGKQHQI
jgi:hypothetical protein